MCAFSLNFLRLTFLLMISHIDFYRCDNVLLNHIDYNYYNVFHPHEHGPGEPLFLTPLIEAGRIDEALYLSKVRSFVIDSRIISYAGLLTVNKTFNSNLFFWFFQSSETDWNDAPVTLWLQGGPGYSSLFGLFNENGPYKLGLKNVVKTRKYSWNRLSNLIYIDSPVGTGFSFTDAPGGYARNQTSVGLDLYNGLVQFFKLFSNLVNNPFYISGESYAGKYIPALGHVIHNKNLMSPELKINLQGLFIGNGLTDPKNMIPKYGDQLYSLGFLDYNGKIEFNKKSRLIINAINNEDWDTATLLYTQLIIGYSFSFPYPTLYNNLTGITSYYNFVNENSAKWLPFETDFVKSNYFRRSVHIGNIKRDSGSMAQICLRQDIAKSVKDFVEELLNAEQYRIMFYNGQLDIICAYPLTENFLRRLEWKGSNKYKTAKRHLWLMDNVVAGYIKNTSGLFDVLIRNAGHMVPTDQPKWAFVLFNKFIYNKPL